MYVFCQQMHRSYAAVDTRIARNVVMDSRDAALCLINDKLHFDHSELAIEWGAGVLKMQKMKLRDGKMRGPFSMGGICRT